VITARFESLHPLRPAWAVGEPVEPGWAWATCFALMERQGGLAFEQRWLGERVPAYRIPDPHRLPGGH
jgi:hypothetical protein